MFASIRAFFLQPYPDSDNPRAIVISAAAAGLIVFFVLYFLEPFGVHHFGKQLIWKTSHFGLITFCLTLSYELTIRYLLGIRRDTPEWTFLHWLICLFILIFLIAVANYGYALIIFENDASFETFYHSTYQTVLVGIFPASLLGGWNLIRNLRANQRLAETIETAIAPEPSNTTTIHIPLGQSGKSFEISVGKILYLEAMQNYIQLAFLDDDEEQKELLRTTLAIAEEALQGTNVVRCHRSFLVNRAAIKTVSGNAQGLKLKLGTTSDRDIPVSRKYIPEFKTS